MTEGIPARLVIYHYCSSTPLNTHRSYRLYTGSYAADRAVFQHGLEAIRNTCTATLGPDSAHTNTLKLQNVSTSSRPKSILQHVNCAAEEVSSEALLTQCSVNRGRPQKNYTIAAAAALCGAICYGTFARPLGLDVLPKRSTSHAEIGEGKA